MEYYFLTHEYDRENWKKDEDGTWVNINDEDYDEEEDYGECGGSDYIPVHRRCPRCGSWSAKLLEDGTYSCIYCSAHFFNDRLIK